MEADSDQLKKQQQEDDLFHEEVEYKMDLGDQRRHSDPAVVSPFILLFRICRTGFYPGRNRV